MIHLDTEICSLSYLLDILEVVVLDSFSSNDEIVDNYNAVASFRGSVDGRINWAHQELILEICGVQI